MLAREPGGNVLYGLGFGVALALIYRLYSHLRALQERVHQLEQEAAAPESAATGRPEAARQPVPRPPATVAPPTSAAAPATPAAPVAASPAGAVAPPALPPSPPRQPPAPPQPTAFDRAIDEFKAWLRRGNPVARAGIVVLFFGGSFLAKYAADHSMFPLELRLALLGAGALVLLGLGWRLRNSRPVYAQTLQGGGIAGFYLTVFAATRLYHLLPLPLALGLMVTVALAAAVLAVGQNALALAVIGTSGGFLAPILLSTGGGSLAALFTYYTVLNLGVFTVAWFRAWRVLNLVGFVFTFGVAGLFRATAYTASQQDTMVFFLWLFFLLYVAVSVLFSLRYRTDLKGYVSGSLVFGLPLAVFSLHSSVVGHAGFALAWSALGLGGFYLALATALFRTRRDSLRLLAEAFAALGVIFATLAVPLGFDQHTTALAWAVEGAGLVWLGVRQQRKLARAFGLLLQLVGGLGYLAQRGYTADYPLLNGLYLGGLSLALAGLASGWWLFRNRERRADYEALLDHAAALWGTLWWFGSNLAEIQRFAESRAFGAGLALAALSSVAYEALGKRLNWPLPRHIAVAAAAIAAAFGLAVGTNLGHPLAEAGWLGWPLLLGAAWWLLYQLDRAPDTLLQGLLDGLHAACALLLVLLLAQESSWQVRQQIGGVWPLLPWGLAPALALVLVGRGTLAPAWPLRAHPEAYRLYAGAPLALGAVLWVLLLNLSSDGDPRELPYLPLLNPLDLTTLLVFGALLRWWRALEPGQAQRLTPPDPRLLPGAAAALVFLWLNAALIRGLHYLAGTPLDLDGVARSFTVQAALSVFWGLLGFAAMGYAARRAQRTVWLAGAGLMAVLLLKMFLVDTAGRGTLARIVSFLAVGALLLLTGYVSPLPPRREPASDPENQP
jgi:uncharacterized membrane protein